jgi:DNA-binding IclR family transcriptional regulator
VNLNAIANRAGTARELITEMGASPAAVHDAATMAVENGYLKVQETITEKGRKVYILTTVNSGNNTYDDDEEIPFR